MYKSDSQYKSQQDIHKPVQRIDYEETFSQVVWYESVEYLLAHAALLNWAIKAMDVTMAYL